MFTCMRWYNEFFAVLPQVFCTLFTIATVSGAILCGVANAFAKRGKTETAKKMDVLNDKGLLWLFDWITSFSEIVVLNIFKHPWAISAQYAIGLGFFVATYRRGDYLPFCIFNGLMIWLSYKLNAEKPTSKPKLTLVKTESEAT